MKMKFSFHAMLLGSLLAGQSAFSQVIDWAKKANPLSLPINEVSFNADGSKVLSGTDCHPASIRMFDVTTGSLEWDHTVSDSYMCIMGVGFSSNSRYVAAIEEFGNIFIFDNTGSSPVLSNTIVTGTTYGFSLAIAPGNHKIAIGCSDGRMKIYDIADGDLLHDVSGLTTWVTSVCYSPDGKHIVSGGSDYKVRIWDTNGSLIQTCSGHTGQITRVRISPDSRYIVSSSKDNTIKIWELSTGALLNTLSGHLQDVKTIDISPDGTKIVSGSLDSTCKIWDMTSGTLIRTFGAKEGGAVNAVAWSPKGDRIATGSSTSNLLMWKVPATFTGIEQTGKTDPVSFSVYPNPCGDELSLNIHKNMIVKKVRISDMTGRILYESSDYNEKIPTGKLSTGQYILTIDNGEITPYSITFTKQ